MGKDSENNNTVIVEKNMESQVVAYKSSQRFAKIPSCTFDVAYLKKLFEILNDINREAAQLEISKLNKTPGQSDSDFEKLKELAISLYKINIEIFGSKGEYIISESPEVFGEAHLPDYVTKVIFDNSVRFKMAVKSDPQFRVRVCLDFSKPPIFDFLSSPSYPTPNDSSIQVLGLNQTWVEGAYEKVMSSLKERKTSRQWLHQKNIYDLLVWFLFLPISFLNIYKIEKMFFTHISNLSTVFLVALYVYIFFTFLFIFRMFFNYSRWVFSYLELTTSLKKGAAIHRTFYAGLFLAIVYSMLSNVVLNLIKSIFSIR